MKRIFRSPTLTEAHLVLGILKGNGIEAVLRNEHLCGLAGEVPFMDAWPEVWVADDGKASRAEGIIADYQRGGK
jgi:hypothetical protein